MGAFMEWAKPLGGISIDEYAEGVWSLGPEFTILSQMGVSHLPPELVGAFVVALLERLHGPGAGSYDEAEPGTPAEAVGAVKAPVASPRNREYFTLDTK